MRTVLYEYCIRVRVQRAHTPAHSARTYEYEMNINLVITNRSRKQPGFLSYEYIFCNGRMDLLTNIVGTNYVHYPYLQPRVLLPMGFF